jgi:hypothetical protein
MKKNYLFILLASLCFLSFETQATVIFVDHSSTGTNTGASWTNAYTSLQSAVAVATTGDEVWVAAGTYTPSAYPVGRTTTDTREYAFYLESGVAYYGGFDGTETSISQRDYVSNVTILSGDIGTANSTSDNCYHVLVSVNESTAHTLDGFTITKGNANGGTNATINGQTGIWTNNGGAMYFYVSNTIISNCIFEDNYGQYGGAIKDVGSPLTFANTIFANNESFNHGGAFDKEYGNPTSFVNCLFYNNTANRTSSTMGGALQLSVATAGTTITNCTFFNNKAGQGGAIRAYNSPVTAKNTIFYDNYQGSSKTANGSDLWNGGAGTSFTMNYCLMQLANSTYSPALASASNNNIHATDPLFINSSDPDGADNVWMTKDDGLKLKSTSPAVDAGLNSAISSYSTDILGTARVVNTTVNMGAYEFLACQQGNALPTAAGTYTSTYADTDGSYTCYCDDDQKLLLALDTTSTGAVVPTTGVSLEIGASTTTSWTSSGGIITNSSGGSIINRKWNVAPTTQPTSDVTVIYPFTNTEASAIISVLNNAAYAGANDLQMYKLTSSGTFADPHASGATGAVLAHGASASTSNWVWSQHSNGTDHLATYKVSSFSGGGGGGGAGGSPLPVELIHFDAQAAANRTADLHWATASELNNNYFDVERSYDAIHWEWVGKVTGNGTTNQLTDYSFTDKSIATSQNTAYYRLKQVDFDGAFEYSNERVVSFDGKVEKLEIAAYPNPSNQEVTIRVNTNELYSIDVTNINGLLLLAIDNTKSQTHMLDLTEWTSGVYIVNVTSSQGTKHLKIIKQ